MTSPNTIVCRPTPWFLLRAGVMLAMFGVFAVLFYIDGSTGYRKKNESFYLNKTFQTANQEFLKQESAGSLTPAAWKEYAAAQHVAFPEDPAVLPADIVLPMPWPAELQDYDKMKSSGWNILWREYTRDRGLDSDPPEESYSARKMKEQWVFFCVCSVLALIAAFFLLRTLRRSLSADDDGVTTQKGKRVPYAAMKVLDMRKWETKGLAFIDFEGASGKGRIRIDGLTYGGFKKENDEPAERLMQKIRSRFAGEIVEYTSAAVDEEAAGVLPADGNSPVDGKAADSDELS